MTFARRVLRGAGIYGLLALLPMYFLEQRQGVDFPPPITHPEFYYGFVGVAVAWQVAFLIMSTDPARYRRPEEVLRHSLLDPIARCEAWLRHHDIGDEIIDREKKNAEDYIAGTIAAAEAAPFPGIADLVADVQDIGAPTWPA